jgi:MFS family permease
MRFLDCRSDVFGSLFWLIAAGEQHMPSSDKHASDNDNSPARAQLNQWLAFGGFGMFGAIFGIWQVLVADLQVALAISPGQFGLTITVGFLASFPVMIIGGRLVDRFGARVLLLMTACGISLAFFGVSQVQQYITLFPLMLLFFGSAGGMDVAINAMAVRVEQKRGDSILPYFHATYSGFAGLMAMLTGVALALMLPFRWVFVLASVAMGLFALIVWLNRAVTAKPGGTDAGASDSDSQNTLTSFDLPNRTIIATLGVVALLTFLTEGALETWSATYLRLTLDLPPVQGAAAPATFHMAMMVGRLFSGSLVERTGRYRFLRLAGGMAALGLVLSLATTFIPLILGGLLLAGLSLAGVVPVVFSLAGKLAPQRIGRASALITTIGYGGFVVGPSLIGGLADALSLRGGLAVLILLCVLLIPLSLFIERRSPSGTYHE